VKPRRDGDRATTTRPTVQSSLDSQCTAASRIEAAITGLAAALIDERRDKVFAAEAAIWLLDAALRDIESGMS